MQERKDSLERKKNETKKKQKGASRKDLPTTAVPHDSLNLLTLLLQLLLMLCTKHISQLVSK